MAIRGRSSARDGRAVAAALLVCVVLAVVLFGVAAAAYPGGTHFDHLARGHDFWRNTLCDVARSTAIGGAPNDMGAAFARAAMAVMALAVGALFWLMPACFSSSRRIGHAVRALGGAASAGACAVAFLPTDRFGALHGVAIVAAGIPGLAAAHVSVMGLLRARARPVLAPLGAAAVAVATVDLALYVHELVAGGPPRIAVAVLERIAVLLVIAWMVGVALVVWRRLPGARPRRDQSIPCSRSLL